MCQVLDSAARQDHPKQAKKKLNFGEKCQNWTARFVQMFSIYNIYSCELPHLHLALLLPQRQQSPALSLSDD